MAYPKHFPNDCPPSECDIASGEFYRYIKNEKPEPEDFLSWRQENPERQCPKGTSECQACGVSIYLSWMMLKSYLVESRILGTRK